MPVEVPKPPIMTEPLIRKVPPLKGAPGMAYQLTDAGIEFVKYMASRGNTKKDTSRALGVHEDWVAKQCIADPKLRSVWDEGDAAGLAQLRSAGFEMAMVNPAQNQFERKVRAGEGERKQVDINHRVHVVGTLPDQKTYSTEEWLSQYSPERLEVDDREGDH